MSISSAQTTHDNISLEFRNLNYSVRQKKDLKVILSNINGQVSSGETLAILGASGSGKSSLLSMLTRRIPKNVKASGDLLVNGLRLSEEKMKNISGYVPQQDLLYTFQSVEETIAFSAELRCPAHYNKEQCLQRGARVIEQLGLSNCQSTRIGSDIRRGVSGGEKKRVAIGVEIVRNVQMLFLDEPTSGLDSFIAYTVVKKLSDLAKKNNKIVIFTIHQPRSNMFELFDKLMLISKGKTVYFGDAKKAVAYFSELGFDCPENFNFTDYILDISTQDFRSEKKLGDSETKIKVLQEKWAEREKLKAPPETVQELGDIKFHAKRKKSFFQEVPVVLGRQFREYFRNYIFIIGVIFQNVFSAVLVGGVFYGLGDNTSTVQDRLGALFYLLVNQSVAPIFQTISIFFQVKEVYLREYIADYYSVLTLYFVNFIMCVLMEPVYTLVFTSVVYPMTGLRSGGKYFFILYAVLLFSKLCAITLGLMISSAVSKFMYAQIVAPIFLYIIILYGGLYINVDHINKVLKYIQYGNFLRYTFEIAVNNEFGGRQLACTSVGEPQCPLMGETVIANVGFKSSRLYVNYIVVFSITIIFIALGATFLWVNMPKFSELKPVAEGPNEECD